MCGQIFTRRCELEIWVVCSVAYESFEENWSFKPPVTKQFRIERSDNDRFEAKFADFANLLKALFQKVIRMLCRRVFGCRSVIQLFLSARARDPMVFHAREFSDSASDRPQMFHRQIETNVAIKFPVRWITRVALMRTPHLAASVGIECESSWTRWCIKRAVNRSTRKR